MSNAVNFALNQMVAPHLPVRAFIDLAASLGCMGVELRNDLRAKGVSQAAFLDGESPEEIGQYAAENNIQILGLSEVYGFNRWSDNIEAQIEALLTTAERCGAQTISLIPDNSGAIEKTVERVDLLASALEKIQPMLASSDVTGLIEPLGFSTSTLRLKADAVAAIGAVGGHNEFQLVYDSFHHFLSGEAHSFSDFTAIVHISGVTDPDLAPQNMADAHRILVNADDRLRNIAQIKSLLDDGYNGAFSFEPFSPLVHRDQDIARSLAASMEYIFAQLVNV